MQNNLIEIAEEIFSKNQTPLHFRDIAQSAMVLYPSLGADLDAVASKFSNSLSNHVKRHGNKKTAVFKRIANGKGGYKAGIYALRVKKPKVVKPTPLPTPAPTKFLGTAGEYGVFSELLFWGYNPAIPAVDHGIDIIAFDNNNDFFNIQVKTSNPNQGGVYSYKIDMKAFERNNNSKTFYVFVVRSTSKHRQVSEYVIMPSNEINRLISIGTVKAESAGLSIRISKDGNTYKLNNKYELSSINDFSIIK